MAVCGNRAMTTELVTVKNTSTSLAQVDTDCLHDIEHSTAHFLMTRYGPLLDSKALMDVLHYPTLLALDRSVQRGNVKLRMFHLPGRRGVFAHARDVASYIALAASSSPN